MKQTLIFFFILFVMSSRLANAHTLENETTIGAILHVSPEDDPIAGEISTLSFDITDTTDRFDPNLCECTVTISENDSVVATIPVYEDPSENTSDISLIYTFPKIGVYQVTLSGKPRTGSLFDEFSLSYDVRVARERELKKTDENPPETTPTQEKSQIPIFISGALILIVIVLTVLILLRKKRRKS